MRRDRLAGATSPDDELVELIYGALLGESPWQKFLNRLADSAPSGKTLLVLHDQRKNNGYIPLASGIPQDVLHAYNSHFARINPFMKPASVKPVGVGLIDEELMPSSELIKSEFFNDLLKPHEMPARVALTINRDSGYQFVLASLGNAFDEECKLNIANQLTRLYPHLKRASDYYRNNPDISAATELGSSLFDAIDVGLVIVGDRARMKAVSRTGELMLSRSSAISVSTLGTVSLRDPNAHAVLKDMLGRTYTGPKVVGIATATTELTMVRLQRDDISTFFDGPTVALLMGFSSDQRSVARRRRFDTRQDGERDRRRGEIVARNRPRAVEERLQQDRHAQAVGTGPSGVVRQASRRRSIRRPFLGPSSHAAGPDCGAPHGKTPTRFSGRAPAGSTG